MLRHEHQHVESEQNRVEQAMLRLSTPPAKEKPTEEITEIKIEETREAKIEDKVEVVESTAPRLSAESVEIAGLVKANEIRKRNLRWMSVPILMVMLVLAVVPFLLNLHGPGQLLATRIMLGFMVVNYAALAALLPATLEKHHRAVRALANTEDLGAVGAMIEALFTSETSNSIAGSVLIRLLPRMCQEDAALLSPAQRQLLRKALLQATNQRALSRYNPTLALAILKALARIGEAEDLSALEKVLQRRVKPTEQKRLADAATGCHTYLTARLNGIETAENPFDKEQQTLESTQTACTSETVATVSSQLRQIARLRQGSVKITLAMAIGGIGLALFSMLHGANHPPSPQMLMSLIGSVVIMIFFAMRGLYTQRNLTQSLMHTDDLRLVAPLLESAASSEMGGEVAAMILTSLLSRLRASDAELLDTPARANLNRALTTHRRNIEFVLATLQALQQVGDATALPTVQKLAESRGRSAAAQRVRAAAQECLPFLQQRAAQAQASQTLLRASDSLAIPSDTLLRPAQSGNTPVEEKTMLRPAMEPRD